MKKLSFYLLLIGSLSLVAILTLAPLAQAQVLETWTGSVSFPFKVTSLDEGPSSGDTKFINHNESFAGTMSLYVGADGPTKNEEGCYIKFLGEDGTTICIRNIAVISTEVKKSKNEKVLIVGTGDFSVTIQEGVVTGIVYLDANGSLKEDSSNNPISAALSGKIGGGFDSDFTFSVSFRATLTK